MRELVRVRGLLLAMALVGAGFALILSVGFALNGPDSSRVDSLIAPSAVIVVLSAIGLVLHIGAAKRAAVPARASRPLDSPVLPPPSPDQLAYAADPMMLGTCVHLQPIERDMRLAGVGTQLSYGQVVFADCLIDLPVLRQRYRIAEPVFYTDSIPGDHPGEPDGAMLGCRAHRSSIGVTPPTSVPPGTPVFPA